VLMRIAPEPPTRALPYGDPNASTIANVISVQIATNRDPSP